jgi:hypothetical protein
METIHLRIPNHVTHYLLLEKFYEIEEANIIDITHINEGIQVHVPASSRSLRLVIIDHLLTFDIPIAPLMEVVVAKLKNLWRLSEHCIS